MTKRMLIDASHAEETRVVVLDGNRLEDFDVETSTKRQLKGNIYLAKVVRVEPSLQAAFVEYGGNRHGFLAFSEIHPDYYQIPVADRQRLIEMEAEEAREEEEAEDRAAGQAGVSGAAMQPSPRTRQSLQTDAAEVRSFADAEVPAEPGTADSNGVADAVAPRSSDADALSAGAPEPPAAETGDESGATGAMREPAAGIDVPAAAMPEPPGAATSDESDANGAMPDEAADAEEPEPAPRSRPRAQPLIIEPETLSESVETAEALADATESAAGEAVAATPQPTEAERPQVEPAAESSVAETGDESGGTIALLAELQAERADAEPDTVEPDRAARRGTRPPRRAQKSAPGGDEPIGNDEAAFGDMEPESPPPETVGGEQDNDDRGERRMPPRFMRNYKIQEVIKRRQIMLVQVVKEERGTKGAALTTYISLAGRFSVLMPNSPRGGGISRKITSATDRRRLKEIVTELDMPKGMGLIVRTAGAQRPKPEIKRDCEYLLRLWDDIREHTLKSVAPALIYEEASLIKRAIRDVYSRDVDEIQVDGEDGWRAAHDFMRMLMPTHAKKVQLWRDSGQPLFARYQVEAQLDAMLLPTVQLRSGGYLVINQTEALVAIDVNSGRSTRERNVEETALRTNLEAADEAARQLRLRDLAGLIVIDFIDMESKKHNAMVERRLKEALQNDRARIQVGHISHFGLLEMSRQRLRPSLAETSFIPCPQCGGMGHVRSTESAALHVLRGIEEEGSRRRSAEIVVHMATPIALYILNHKRDRLHEIELRYGMRVTLSGDDRQIEPQFRIDRLRPQVAGAVPAVITPDMPQPALPPPPMPEAVEEEEEEEEPVAAEVEAEAEEAAETAEEQQAEGGEMTAEEAERRHRRRRRRRRGRRDEPAAAAPAEPGAPADAAAAPAKQAETYPAPEEAAELTLPIETHIEGVPEHLEPAAGEEDDGRGRRRGRRGGRRRRREPGEGETAVAAPGAEQPDLPPVYTGPTPANPFGGHAFDIFDMLEQAEGFAAPAPSGTLLREVTVMPEPSVAVMPEAAAATGVLEPTEHLAPEPDEPLAIVNTAAPEPAGEALVREEEAAPAAAAPAEPEPAAMEAEADRPIAANDAPPEPVVKPIIIGGPDEPAVEKKRGWWRR